MKSSSINDDSTKSMDNSDKTEENLTIWASILRDVKTSTKKGPSTKSLVVLGDNESGRTTLVAKLQGNDDPKRGAGLEYHYINIKDEDRDDTPKLGVWILDGDVACSAPLLKFAIKPESVDDSFLILVASMTQPWSLLTTLEKWSKLIEEHLDRLKLDPIRLRDMRDRFQQEYQSYVEPMETSNSLSTSFSTTSLKSLNRTQNSSSTNTMTNQDEQIISPLADGVLNKSFGIPMIVVITKCDAMSTLEKENEYKDEHFDFIQYHLRKFCLEYGAALFYTSVKEKKNIDKLYKYIIHKSYNYPFSSPASIIERDSIFIPSGWDSPKRADILLENLHRIKSTDHFSDVFVKQTSSRRPLQRENEIIVAEDDQEFLSKLQSTLNRSSSPTKEEAPLQAGPKATNTTSNSGSTTLPRTRAAAPSNANATAPSEGALANFFNSLLTRKTAGSVTPTGAAGSTSQKQTLQSPTTPSSKRLAQHPLTFAVTPPPGRTRTPTTQRPADPFSSMNSTPKSLSPVVEQTINVESSVSPTSTSNLLSTNSPQGDTKSQNDLREKQLSLKSSDDNEHDDNSLTLKSAEEEHQSIPKTNVEPDHQANEQMPQIIESTETKEDSLLESKADATDGQDRIRREYQSSRSSSTEQKERKIDHSNEETTNKDENENSDSHREALNESTIQSYENDANSLEPVVQTSNNEASLKETIEMEESTSQIQSPIRGIGFDTDFQENTEHQSAENQRTRSPSPVTSTLDETANLEERSVEQPLTFVQSGSPSPILEDKCSFEDEQIEGNDQSVRSRSRSPSIDDENQRSRSISDVSDKNRSNEEKSLLLTRENIRSRSPSPQIDTNQEETQPKRSDRSRSTSPKANVDDSSNIMKTPTRSPSPSIQTDRQRSRSPSTNNPRRCSRARCSSNSDLYDESIDLSEAMRRQRSESRSSSTKADRRSSRSPSISRETMTLEKDSNSRSSRSRSPSPSRSISEAQEKRLSFERSLSPSVQNEQQMDRSASPLSQGNTSLDAHSTHAQDKILSLPDHSFDQATTNQRSRSPSLMEENNSVEEDHSQIDEPVVTLKSPSVKSEQDQYFPEDNFDERNINGSQSTSLSDELLSTDHINSTTDPQVEQEHFALSSPTIDNNQSINQEIIHKSPSTSALSNSERAESIHEDQSKIQSDRARSRSPSIVEELLSDDIDIGRDQAQSPSRLSNKSHSISESEDRQSRPTSPVLQTNEPLTQNQPTNYFETDRKRSRSSSPIVEADLVTAETRRSRTPSPNLERKQSLTENNGNRSRSHSSTSIREETSEEKVDDAKQRSRTPSPVTEKRSSFSEIEPTTHLDTDTKKSDPSSPMTKENLYLPQEQLDNQDETNRSRSPSLIDEILQSKVERSRSPSPNLEMDSSTTKDSIEDEIDDLKDKSRATTPNFIETDSIRSHRPEDKRSPSATPTREKESSSEETEARTNVEIDKQRSRSPSLISERSRSVSLGQRSRSSSINSKEIGSFHEDHSELKSVEMRSRSVSPERAVETYGVTQSGSPSPVLEHASPVEEVPHSNSSLGTTENGESSVREEPERSVDNLRERSRSTSGDEGETPSVLENQSAMNEDIVRSRSTSLISPTAVAEQEIQMETNEELGRSKSSSSIEENIRRKSSMRDPSGEIDVQPRVSACSSTINLGEDSVESSSNKFEVISSPSKENEEENENLDHSSKRLDRDQDDQISKNIESEEKMSSLATISRPKTLQFSSVNPELEGIYFPEDLEEEEFEQSIDEIHDVRRSSLNETDVGQSRGEELNPMEIARRLSLIEKQSSKDVDPNSNEETTTKK